MMKQLTSLALLLALGGCAEHSPAPQAGNNLQESPEHVAAGMDQQTAGTTLKSKVIRPGLYRLVRSSGTISDPKTGTGKSIAKPVIELVRSTDRIPLARGGQLYFQYRIWPLPAQPAYVDLRRVVRHPAMTLPDGSVSTGSDYTIRGKVSGNQVIAYTGYGLDEDYELVEGDWVFEIWYQDRKVIEQKFTTYRPDKTELAGLEPVLALGNRAVGQNASPGEPFSRLNWPRITVGGTPTATP